VTVIVVINIIIVNFTDTATVYTRPKNK